MCDFYAESIDTKNKKSNLVKKIINRNSPKPNNFIDIINDFNESKSLKADTSQSGSQSPSSFTNPTSPILKNSSFLQNISIKNLPSFDSLHLKCSQINSKSQRSNKVANDLNNKIELLEEIYSGSEYKKFKVKNKYIQCNISLDTPQKIVFNLISKVNPDSNTCFGRSIHPAYSNDINTDDTQMTFDSTGVFKVPVSYTDPLSPANNNNDLLISDYQPVDCDTPIQEDNFFLEHEGNTYIRVDDSNYHLIQSISEDGVITTETGLQLTLPEGTKIPNESGGIAMGQDMIYDDQMMGISNNNNNDMYGVALSSNSSDNNHYYNDSPNATEQALFTTSATTTGRKNHKDNAFLTHYTYQTSNPAKPFSDYVGLPARPPPHTPFTLSSQLYTPDLSISLTDRDCELMLTIDCSKKFQPQQKSLYYQIYSYKDEDRYTKPTSEVWGLVGEISACPLPMFCTISIPSGVHKHYFSIRSVDELNRFSDWSNVVQVEVESNQNSNNGR